MSEVVRDSGVVAEPPAGPVHGRRDGKRGVVAWRGIPYALSPVGALRFRAPQPVARWAAVRECTEFGPVCPQPPGMPMESALNQDEDCLNLNVWAPGTPGEPRPVLVWLHGGAYFMGAGSQGLYSGRTLSEEGDLVVVTVNYRLGALGFVDFRSCAAAGEGAIANAGLRDQIAALEWVRDNIAAFGGDPDSVTVSGESSGAGCVTTLMTSPRASGLFHRAIAQSSPATSVYGPERAAAAARRLVRLLGAWAESPGALREAPARVLAAAGGQLTVEGFHSTPGTLTMAPVVDGDVVPDYPVDAFRDGRQHKVPLLIGTNRSESSIFRLLRLQLMPVTPQAVHGMLGAILRDNPDVTPERVGAVTAGYRTLWRRGTAARAAQDAAFRMPAVWLAEAHSEVAATWLYRFDHASPLFRAVRVGAGHATELPYLFDTFGSVSPDPTFLLGGRGSAMRVAERIRARWIAFTRGQPPDAAGDADWPRYRTPGRRSLVIGCQDEVRIDVDKEARAVWGPVAIGFR